MKKILLDSDVLLDFLRRRKPFFRSAAELFVLIKDKKILAYTSSLVIANIAYLLSKEIPKARTKKVITRILDLLNVIELKENHLRLAASSDFSDFEDAVEYYCALEKRLIL